MVPKPVIKASDYQDGYDIMEYKVQGLAQRLSKISYFLDTRKGAMSFILKEKRVKKVLVSVNPELSEDNLFQHCLPSLQGASLPQSIKKLFQEIQRGCGMKR
ncbi:hypothetical protein E2C01_055872 [Portunus trituberculatus]|uniref:Uncharacterized protein n=1 Tax=Portunus trituberculatus TaxID=210409 RepID=A0A5B7GVW8_PORTR|nr:hypothetical protein [Portunus trituberculatus]